MTPIAGFISIFPYGEAKGKSGLVFLLFLACEPQALLSFENVNSKLVFETPEPKYLVSSGHNQALATQKDRH